MESSLIFYFAVSLLLCILPSEIFISDSVLFTSVSMIGSLSDLMSLYLTQSFFQLIEWISWSAVHVLFLTLDGGYMVSSLYYIYYMTLVNFTFLFDALFYVCIVFQNEMLDGSRNHTSSTFETSPIQIFLIISTISIPIQPFIVP